MNQRNRADAKLRAAVRTATYDIGRPARPTTSAGQPSISQVLKTKVGGTSVTKPGTASRASGFGAMRENLKNVKANAMLKWLRRNLGWSAMKSGNWAGRWIEKWGGKAVRGAGKSLTAVAFLALGWDILQATNKWANRADTAGRGPKQGASLIWDAFGDDDEDVEYKKKLGAITARFTAGFGAAMLGAMLGLVVTSPLQTVPVVGQISAGLITLAIAGLFGLGGHMFGGMIARKLGLEPSNTIMYSDDIDKLIEKQNRQAAGQGQGQGLTGRMNLSASTAGGRVTQTPFTGRTASRQNNQTVNAEESGGGLLNWFMPSAHAADVVPPEDVVSHTDRAGAPTTTKAATAILKGGLSTPPMEDFSKRGAEHDERGMKGWYANEAREQLRRVETRPETIGTTLTALGKNAGVENFDTVQYNISNNNNSASTSVNSQAATTNIIAFDKRRSADMIRRRHGY